MGDPVSSLELLGERVAVALDAGRPERTAALERARRGYLDAVFPSSRRAPSRRGVFALAAALASALLVLGAFTLFRARPLEFVAAGKPGVVDAWLTAPKDDPIPIHFSDGTRVRLEPASRARVVSVDSHGASVALENGSLSADVVHTGHGAWRVTAGPLTVRVTGTRFDVRWSSSSKELAVSVTEGSVAVSGFSATSEQAVRAGETLRIALNEGRLELAKTRDLSQSRGSNAPSPDDPAKETNGQEVTAAVPDPTREAKARPAPSGSASAEDWRELARKGSLREAFAAAEASGFEAACRIASPSELLQLADGARLSGDPARARHALTRLRSAYPSDPRRAAAAFALGKVAFDHTRSYAEAADWFATSIREQPSGSLAREAAGRLIEARQRSGDASAARQAAKSYLARYPQGPHADLARSLAE